MQSERDPTYYRVQAQRCRQLARDCLDRVLEARLIATAETFEELARTAMRQQPAPESNL
jgi:hypothetical protein